jgi:hypothetical protein
VAIEADENLTRRNRIKKKIVNSVCYAIRVHARIWPVVELVVRL